MTEDFPILLSENEWRAKLTPEQYFVLRERGTEHAGCSALNLEKRPGVYRCAGCDALLFSAREKYNSHSGWPSFTEALPGALGASTDYNIGYARTEVHCATCGGHLGHVFPDGPPPTHQRYCINGIAMNFTPQEQK